MIFLLPSIFLFTLHLLFTPAIQASESDWISQLSIQYDILNSRITPQSSDREDLESDPQNKQNTSEDLVQKFYTEDDLKRKQKQQIFQKNVGVVLRETVPLGVGTGVGAMGYYGGMSVLSAFPPALPSAIIAGSLGMISYVGLRMKMGDFFENLPETIFNFFNGETVAEIETPPDVKICIAKEKIQ